MKDVASRASLEELREFANKVREAGGGNPIDALIPARPSDSKACLIAKNLNFNCQVYSLDVNVGHGHTDKWVMVLDDKATRDAIAEKLALQKRNIEVSVPIIEDKPYGATHMVTRYLVILPDRIGAVAAAFDEWEHISYELHEWETEVEFARSQKKRLPRVNAYVSDGTFQWLKEFIPYIDEALNETALIGQLNEAGELIL